MEVTRNHFHRTQTGMMEFVPFWLYKRLPRLYESEPAPFLLADPYKFITQMAWHSNYKTVFPHTVKFRLLKAITQNKIEDIQQILAERKKNIFRFDINQPIDKKYGLNALQYAAITNKYPICQLLLLHGADINHPDQYGQTAFAHAISNNCYEAINTLVKNGCDVFKKDKHGINALDYMKINGKISMLKYVQKNHKSQRIFPKFTVRLEIQKLIQDQGWNFVKNKHIFNRIELYPFNDLRGTYRITLTDFYPLKDFYKLKNIEH